MRVLVWNLFHGRADPPAGRPLLHEFAAALAAWEWDVALLQEVPPWWPPLLGRRCDADWRSALTSRNQLLPLRRAIASRQPDRLKSNGGGANAILVRAPWSITAHGRRRLRILPERRVVHAVRVELSRQLPAASRATDGDPGADVGGPGRDAGERRSAADRPFASVWFGNVHAQLGSWDDAAGMAAPLADLARATRQLEAWEGSPASSDPPTPPAPRQASPPQADPGTLPIILGGDLNLPREALAANLPPGWTRIASSGPDHVIGRGVISASPSIRPDRSTLSDHTPLVVETVGTC